MDIGEAMVLCVGIAGAAYVIGKAFESSIAREPEKPYAPPETKPTWESRVGPAPRMQTRDEIVGGYRAYKAAERPPETMTKAASSVQPPVTHRSRTSYVEPISDVTTGMVIGSMMSSYSPSSDSCSASSSSSSDSGSSSSDSGGGGGGDC